MNECANQGYLVGPKGEILSDPTDFMWDGREPAIGCDRLRCSVCGAMVRQHAGWIVDDEQVKFGAPEYQARVDQLYDSATWDQLPFARRNAGYRIYVCRCGVVREDREEALAFTTVGGMGSGPIPWSCSGHAEVSLPFVIDGVTMATEDEVVQAARRGFSGWRPDAIQADVYGTWTSSLHSRVAGTSLATAIERVTVECFTDADPKVRAGALRFLRVHRNPDGVRAAVDMALAGATQQPEDVQAALADAVARIYEFELLDEPRLRDLIRGSALQPGVRDFVIEALATRDPSWLRQSAEAIVRANPQAAGFVLKSVFDAFVYEGYTPYELAGKLSRIPGVSHEQMRLDVRRYLQGDARDGVLKILDATTALPH